VRRRRTKKKGEANKGKECANVVVAQSMRPHAMRLQCNVCQPHLQEERRSRSREDEIV